MKWDPLVKNWFKRINFFLDPFPVVEEDNWSQSQRWKSPRAVTTFPRLATALQEIRDEPGMEQAGEKETQTDDWKMVWGRAWMSWDSLIQKWKAHRSSSSAGCWGWIGFLVQCHLEKQKSTSLSILESRQGTEHLGIAKRCWDSFLKVTFVMDGVSDLTTERGRMQVLLKGSSSSPDFITSWVASGSPLGRHLPSGLMQWLNHKTSPELIAPP